MKKTRLLGAFCAAVSGFVALPAETMLYTRLGGQAYYDDALDITWIANANLTATNSFGLAYNTNLGDHPSDVAGWRYDELIYTDGGMTWGGALHWIDAMNADGGTGYLGFNDWRLASMSVTAGLPTGRNASVIDCSSATELACRDNELGYMFFHNLGGSNGDDLTGNQTVGDVTLTDIQSYYMSGTEANNRQYAWMFGFNFGFQTGEHTKNAGFHGWAVRNGDVVPIPPALWLFGSGLLGLIGIARRKKAA